MIFENPNGTETYYESQGEQTSETLLLLHGLGADHSMWQPQIQSYGEAGYHLLVPDLFGHGRSSKLVHIALSDWHQQLNWLLDSNDVKQCNLIGVSMGGVIAQSFVVNYPDRVKRLVIADSFGELKTLREKALGLSQVIGFHLFKQLGQQMLAKGMMSVYSADYAHTARDYFGQMTPTVDLDQMIRARTAINRIEVLEELRSIILPALVLVGAEFGQAFIDINRKLADALPNAEFVVLEQAMDPSNLVNPIAFDQQVLKFLNQAR